MITVLFDNHIGRLVRFDDPTEREEAVKLLWKGSDPLGPNQLSLDLPPKTLADLAKIDIFAMAGYVGFRR